MEFDINNSNDKICLDWEKTTENITLFKKDNIELELEFDKEPEIPIVNLDNFDKTEYLNEFIQKQNNNDINGILEKQTQNQINNEIVVIKKKKGRKSKKEKMLLENQLELEKLAEEPVNLFPKLSEVIFDVITINSKEYFYNKNLNTFYDLDSNPVGTYDMESNQYIFYDSIKQIVNKTYNDNLEVEKILSNFKIKKK